MNEENAQGLTPAQQLQYNYLEQYMLASTLSLHMFEGIQAQIENHYGNDKKVVAPTDRVR